MVILSAFEAAGIPAFRFGADVIAAQPALDIAFGGIRIMVSDIDYERAREMLNEREADALESETEALWHEPVRGPLGLLVSLAVLWMPCWTKGRRFRGEDTQPATT